jgi:hypothetical protein
MEKKVPPQLGRGGAHVHEKAKRKKERKKERKRG